jgi:hypothetical protein
VTPILAAEIQVDAMTFSDRRLYVDSGRFGLPIAISNNCRDDPRHFRIKPANSVRPNDKVSGSKTLALTKFSIALQLR